MKNLEYRYPGDFRPLLGDLARNLTRSDLVQIASADYGYRRDEHLHGLLEIVRNIDAALDTQWCPGEVLSLTCWLDPADAAVADIERLHCKRAFACAAVLAECKASSPSYDVLRIIHLLESLEVLGKLDQAVDFLVWMLSDVDEIDEGSLFAGICLIGILAGGRKQKNLNLMAVVQWVLDLEYRYAAEHFDGLGSSWQWQELGKRFEPRLAGLFNRMNARVAKVSDRETRETGMLILSLLQR